MVGKVVTGVLLMTQMVYGDIASFIVTVNPKLAEEQVMNISRDIHRYAAMYNLDPALISAVIAEESAFKPRAIGKSHGEIGLMQLRPEFHLTRILPYEKRIRHLKAPEVNISVGVKYLAGIRAVFEDRYPNYKWLEMWNRGPNCKPPKTFPYTRKVLLRYATIKERNGRQAEAVSRD